MLPSCLNLARTASRPKTKKANRQFFGVHPLFRFRFVSGVLIALAWLVLSHAQAQTTNYALGTTSLLVGPAAGSNSVVLAVTPSTGTWTATTNATWLHLSPANQSGIGSTNVVFSYDANPGATRSGTLTIASQTLTITQAGSTYVAANPVTTLVSSGLNNPQGLAVDGAGNVYIADTYNYAIKKWTLANKTVTTLVPSGLSDLSGVAVDGSSNVYFSDSGNNAIKKWTPASSNVVTLVSSGLYFPDGVVVDGTGNVYIADAFNNAIKKWALATSNVTTLVASGLNYPVGVAVDGAGNVYFSDVHNNAIKKWAAANSNVTTLVSSNSITPLSNPYGVAVDGAGNVYFTDYGNNAIKEWTAANSNVTALVSSNLSAPLGVAVDGTGNIYIADSSHDMIKELPYAFVDPTPKLESAAAGNDALPVVLPSTENLLSPFAPTSDQSWLTITGITNGVVTFSLAANNTDTNLVRTAHITLLGQSIPVTQGIPTYSLGTNALQEGANAGSDTVVLTVNPNFGAWTATANAAWLHLSLANQNGTGGTNVVFSFDANPGAMRIGTLMIAGQTLTITQSAPPYFLGTTMLLVGPAAGTNSVVLAVTPSTGTWTATTNANWLHLSLANQSGTGSTNVIFSYDANPGPTRSGTLAIAGQTLTINQAGSTYLAADSVTMLVSSGLNQPNGVAVDSAGNVYFANSGSNMVQEWTAANNTVTTLVSSGLNHPFGVAVDGAGNVYIADTGNNAIKEWTAANSNVTTLVASGLSNPYAVAVNGVGNVYIADEGNNAVKEWTPANSNATTLVSSGLNRPYSVAVDGTGNVYIADEGNNAIKEWTAANSNVITLVASGLDFPGGVAVDGSGNVYIADSSHWMIKEWTAANSNVTTLVASWLDGPSGVAVDGTGNVYFADAYNSAIKELPYAFVDPTFKLESLTAGNDSLPVVLPITENLLAPFTPTIDQSWLTIAGITNGVVNFAFTDTAFNRTGNIRLFGQTIPVTQGGPTYFLGTTSLMEGPGAGSNSVVLAAQPYNATWTNTANATWLHLSQANQSVTGNANMVFNYDANPGATRFGTLAIGGQTLTITQAGSTYVAADPLTTLVSSGLSSPGGVAVDGAGNVYIADTSHNAIKKWALANKTVVTLVSSGLSSPYGVAVDVAGNVYIADTGNNAIKKWTAANSNVTTLASSGFNYPKGVAVDSAGNVYIADSGNGAIKEWMGSTSNVTALASFGMSYFPLGVAVDGAGNVYFTYSLIGGTSMTLNKWTAANGNLTTLVAGLDNPYGVAVDGRGDVYFAETANNAIKVWIAANSNVTTLVSSGLNFPQGVAVDGAGNIYIADTANNAIKELPYAFVNPTTKLETAAAGNDALPAVLPATENLRAPFAPTNDQSWLTIAGITNGVVSFSFTANTSSARTAHITLLGQIISITQGVIGTPPTLTSVQMMGNGVIQFAFTNTPGASFTVLSTTNLSLPLTNWTVAGTCTNAAPNLFQFTSQPTTNNPQLFYTIRSP